MTSVKPLSSALIILMLLVGCQGSGLRSFWKSHSIDYSDINAAQDQFASFAELAVAGPESEALLAIDALFDKLQEDTVAYYIYTNWLDGAFYNILSPCRNSVMYSKAVDRIVADAILSQDECEPFKQKREWLNYILEGQKATVPGIVLDQSSVVLVLDQSCPSCREALTSLAQKKEWANYRHIAICCGYGPVPTVPGWEYVEPENASAVFDPHMTPVYFVVSQDGTVEKTYHLAI
jgi:hypothetical protein